MVEYVAVVLTGQIEVGVVGEVKDRRSVGHACVMDGKSVVVVPCIGDACVECAWIAFLSVGAYAGERDRFVIFDAYVPYTVLETCRSSMQMVWKVALAMRLA